MKKTKRILYIILVVVVATVLMISPVISASADTVRDQDYKDIYLNFDENEYYNFNTPFEGYNYYFIINSATKYDVVFVKSTIIPKSNDSGLQFYTNIETSEITSVKVSCLSGFTMKVCTVLFSSLEEHFEAYTHLEAINILLLRGYLDDVDYVTIVDYESFNFNYYYTVNSSEFVSTSSAPYYFKYTPILAGNFPVSWPMAVGASSYSIQYNVTFSPDNGLRDVFRENSAYDKGNENGYNVGYSVGYDAGLEQNMEDVTGFSVITYALTSVMEVLNMKVFGYFSLGDVISVALVFGVVFFVFKLIRG